MMVSISIKLYGVLKMESTSANKFRENMKGYVEQVVKRHEPLKVTHRNGEDFVIISAEDWEREQETLHVLQNNDLMKQIADSLDTHAKKSGYLPTDRELNEIAGI
ncbi:MAG: type II toxin-antitoxin system Phd/YefM family antitoxin [Candidatus Methylumidiphilus sp.]